MNFVWVLPLVILFSGEIKPGLRLDKNKLYIVARATNTKAGMIARMFNAYDTLITHIGLGFFDQNKFLVAHVEDKPGNALTISTLNAFNNSETYYLSIYEIPAKKPTLRKVRRWVQNHLPITFDHQFNLQNETYYCSEFLWKALSMVLKKNQLPPPRKYPLTTPFHRAYLKTDTLQYIPVDFFQKLPGIKMIYECYPNRTIYR